MKLFKENNLREIGEKLITGNESVAVAESVTSGLLQLAMASIENAMQFYQGGITAYNIGQKYKHLAVEPIHAQKANCVSEKVAREMALEVCNLFNSNWGISITGYASPVPESANHVYAYYAIASEKKIIKCAEVSTEVSNPFEVQLHYVNTILDDFKKLLAVQGS